MMEWHLSKDNMNIFDIKKNYLELNLFLVLDSAQISEYTETILKKVKQSDFTEVYSLFAQTKENNLPWEVSPLLFNLSLLDDVNILKILDELWLHETVIQVIGVKKKIPLKVLMNKLKMLLELEMPDGTVSFFRWYDPRIMENINFLLEKKDSAELFRNIDFWFLTVIDIDVGTKVIKNKVSFNV